MKTKIVLTLVMFTLFLISCDPETEITKFTLERSFYSGDKIRFNGCYYRDLVSDNTSGSYVFYYRNGVVLSFIDKKGIKSINDFNYLDKKMSMATSWWVYKISGDTMITQGRGGFCKDGIVTSFKLMINDTTLQAIKSKESCGDFKYNNYVSHMQFIKMYPRPDSTNIFTE